MTMNQCWTTKEEVLNDLAEVTGFRVFDDDYIIRGTRPPPPRRDLDIDEEECRLRYGGEGDINAPLADEKLEPDLVGITQMLRMVEESTEPDQRMDWRKNLSSNPFGEGIVITKKKPLAPVAPQNWRERESPRSGSNNTTSNNRLKNPPPGFNWRDRKAPRENIKNSNNALENTSPSFPLPKTGTEILAPNKSSSKLNPDVPSFIPNGLKPDIMPVIVTEQVKSENIDFQTNYGTSEKLQNISQINSEHETQEKPDATQTSMDDEKILAEILKKKIIEASRADKKREKNVAMAALLRLKSTPRSTTPSSSKSSPKASVVSSKAQSPNMKEQSVASAKPQSPVEISTGVCKIAQDQSVDKTEERTFEIIKPPTSVPTSDSPNNFVLFTPEYFESVKPNVKVETPKTEEIVVTSPIHPELAKRVIDWMDDVKSESPSPKTVKTPVKLQLVTKPVGFTKKQTIKSPLPVPQSNTKKVAEPIPCYVPTRNASKLAQQYEEAMKDDVTPPPQNSGFLTEALLQQLKSKDEEFKKRKQQNEREEGNSSPSTLGRH